MLGSACRGCDVPVAQWLFRASWERSPRARAETGRGALPALSGGSRAHSGGLRALADVGSIQLLRRPSASASV